MGARRETERKSFLRFRDYDGLGLFYPVRKAPLALLDIKYLTEGRSTGVKLKILHFFTQRKCPVCKPSNGVYSVLVLSGRVTEI